MATFSVTRAFASFEISDGVTGEQSVEIFGLQGTVTDVSVSLIGLTHTFPADLDFMLVGPDSTSNLVFMSDIPIAAVNGANLTISDYAETAMFDSLASGIYRPADYGELETASDFGWDTNSPVNRAGPNGGATFASAFSGIAPNGFWSFRYQDDASGDAGSLASWGVTITTSSNAVVINDAGGLVVVATGATSGFYSLNQRTVQFSDVTSFTYSGGAGADTIRGGAFNEVINGGDGSDTLDGRAGADTMSGGVGNDIYLVDNAGDKVIEAVGGGSDRVAAGISYVLAAGQEIELFTTNNAGSTSALDLTGNEFANYIIGNAGANRLDGRVGADTMQGVGGNDIYLVDNAGDLVLEAVGGGNDRVAASVSYVLMAGQEIELFTTTNTAGIAAISMVGNAHNQTIIGNAGNNILNGGAGKDTLTGLGGKDSFVFNTALNPATNVDIITDFSVVDDAIVLENAVFAGLAAGTLSANAFRIGAAAADADDRIIYNNATGQLIFDSNGSAAGGATQFATIAAGLALTNTDFVII